MLQAASLPGTNRPLSATDQAIRRSAFTSYGLYNLPFGGGQMFANNVNWLVNGIIGGWEFSPAVIWQSGLPFSLSYSACGASIPGDAPCRRTET